jgi:TonB-linked SusC/RagA family outer membrane protein
MYQIFTQNLCRAFTCIPARLSAAVYQLKEVDPMLKRKMIMRINLTSIFITLCFLNVSASTMAQKISFNKKSATFAEFFKVVKKQTGYNVLYSNKEVDDNQTVNVDLTDAPLTDALNAVLKPNHLNYSIDHKTILITHKSETLQEKPMDQAVAPATIKVTGKVTDETGQPLPGVTIKIKGENRATVATGSDGSFSISVPDKKTILVFSFVGYVTQEVPVNIGHIMNVKLQQRVNTMEDVVVVGYGSQKKRNLTGAIATVKGDDLDLSTSANVTQSLQGKVAGLTISQPTGQPGANVWVQLRANPSNANQGVLYVVDGIPVNDNPGTPSTALGGTYGTSGVDQSPLNFINPNDIESISFLKDASAASIYGARAGAGVILITTKKGSSGKPTVRYSGNYSIQKTDRLWDLLGTKDYMVQRNLINQEYWAYTNHLAPYYGNINPSTVSPFVPLYSQATIDTTSVKPSALAAVLRQGYVDQQNVSISGGNGKGDYFASFNYFDQQGVLLASDLKRYNGKISLNQNVSETFKVGASALFSNSRLDNSNTGGLYQQGGVFTAASYWPANLALRGADGSYPLNPDYSNTPNPLSYETVTDFTNSFRLLTSGYAQWEFVKGLTAKTVVSYDQAQNTRNSYYPRTFLYGYSVNGAAGIGTNGSNSLQAEYTLNYNHSFFDNKLNVTALGGYSYQRTLWTSVFAGNQQFISDAISYYNLGAGQAPMPSVSSGQSQNTWLSEFARANFSWVGKYYLQVSYRRDGASNFAENKKWASFPSISASWIASDEDFIKSLRAISFLKLRAGYGETGNSAFPGSAYATYGISSSPLFGNNQPYTGIKLTQAASPNLTWETVGEYNLGLDFGLLKDRLTGTVDLYSKTVRNMIVQIPLPSDNLTSFVWGNAGKARTNGWEISLTSKNIIQHEKGGFTWSTTANLSHYYSYWVQRDAATLANLKGTPWVAATGKNAPVDGVYGYKSAGIYTGTWGNQPTQMPGMLPGGIIIKDINGFDSNGNLTGKSDGKIDAADQTLLYNADPKLIYGLSNTFTYKNFDLNVLFSGFIRKTWDPAVPLNSSSMQGRLKQYGWNVLASVDSRWTYLNPTGTQPTGVVDNTYNGFQGNSDYWEVNGSFIKCKNITLGYSLPSELLKRKVAAVRFFVDLQNVFTITGDRLKGMDPEVSQSNYYPLTRSYSAGVNVTF